MTIRKKTPERLCIGCQTVHPKKELVRIVRSPEGVFSVDFKELWRYRDLCSLFVKRNIITQYKQTILGPVWFVVQPALTVIMYMIVFGGIAGIPTDGVPRPLFYLAGNCFLIFCQFTHFC